MAEEFDESIEIFSKDPKAPLGYPPGKMGELCWAADDYSRFSYKIVNIFASLGAIAGIVGRRHNVSDTGLNITLTLLMGTGTGKDMIRHFINDVHRQCSPPSGAPNSFIGPKRMTGPKAINGALRDNRSIVCVLTEAGLVLSSGTGDPHGILRTFLDYYSCSGRYQYSEAEKYSTAEESINAIRAPALTVINESTPSSFEAELQKRKSIESGELARMTIIRREGSKPYGKFGGVLHLNDDLKKTIRKLMQDALPFQSQEDPQSHVITFDKDLFQKFSNKCVDFENTSMIEEDYLMKAIVSRAPLKVLKIASLCAVMDADWSSGYPVSNVTIDHWNWAMELFRFELNSLQFLFKGVGSVMNTASYKRLSKTKVTIALEKYFYMFIIKLLRNKYGQKNKGSYNSPLNEFSVVTQSQMLQVTRHNMTIARVAMGMDTGQLVCLKQMVIDKDIEEIKYEGWELFAQKVYRESSINNENKRKSFNKALKTAVQRTKGEECSGVFYVTRDFRRYKEDDIERRLKKDTQVSELFK